MIGSPAAAGAAGSSSAATVAASRRAAHEAPQCSRAGADSTGTWRDGVGRSPGARQATVLRFVDSTSAFTSTNTRRPDARDRHRGGVLGAVGVQPERCRRAASRPGRRAPRRRRRARCARSRRRRSGSRPPSPRTESNTAAQHDATPRDSSRNTAPLLGHRAAAGRGRSGPPSSGCASSCGGPPRRSGRTLPTSAEPQRPAGLFGATSETATPCSRPWSRSEHRPARRRHGGALHRDLAPGDALVEPLRLRARTRSAARPRTRAPPARP